MCLCTRDRAPLLARALDSLGQLRTPDGIRWELVVVDNGSSDDTMDVVAAAARRLAREVEVRAVREPTPGISHARNRAVR